MNPFKLLTVLLFMIMMVAARAGLNSDSRQICGNTYCFFINQGVVYKGLRPSSLDPDQRIQGQALPHSADVKSIVLHKGNLVALQNNGKAWLWATDAQNDSYWVQLSKEGKKLYSDDQNLYLVTKNGKLLIHDNDLRISWHKVNMYGLIQGSASNVFYDSDREDVSSLNEKDGRTIVIDGKGKKTDVHGLEVSSKTKIGETESSQLAQSDGDRDGIKEISDQDPVQNVNRKASVATSI